MALYKFRIIIIIIITTDAFHMQCEHAWSLLFVWCARCLTLVHVNSFSVLERCISLAWKTSTQKISVSYASFLIYSISGFAPSNVEMHCLHIKMWVWQLTNCTDVLVCICS